MTDHAILSASAAHRWVPCPGSVAVTKDLPRTTSAYADEGTAAHALAAWCLLNRTDTTDFTADEIEIEPAKVIEVADDIELVPAKMWPVDHDMRRYVQQYVDYLRRHALQNQYVETRVDYSEAIGVPGQFGTSDYMQDGLGIYKGVEAMWVEVHDLKYGQGEIIEAEGNLQLMLYAEGHIGTLDLDPNAEVYVRLVIHQPRVDSIKEQVLSLAELRAKIKVVAQAAKVAMYDPEAPRVPGEKQCRWCGFKVSCPEAKAVAFREVVGAFDVLAEDVPAKAAEVKAALPNMSVVDLAHSMSLVDFVEGWAAAVRGRVFEELNRGVQVPGYKLVMGKRGNRAWSNPGAAEEAMKSMRLKREEMYKFSLISPTVAEEVLKDSPKRWERLQEFISRSDGKPSVAPESDKRPAIAIVNPASEFEDHSLDDLA